MFGFSEAQLSMAQRSIRFLQEGINLFFPVYSRTGTKEDGNFNPTSNTTLTKNVYNWNEVNIPAGVTVTAKTPGAAILCKKITISGLLTASGFGAAGGSGSADNGAKGSSGGGLVGGGGGSGGGGSQGSGGAGGNGRSLGAGEAAKGTNGLPGSNDIVNVPKNLWDAMLVLCGGGGGQGGNTFDGMFSGAGGSGGNGGGFLFICTNELIINSGGAIRADGINGANASAYNGVVGGGGGGGGGGVIIIDTLSLINNGAVSVDGGAGGAGHKTGGKGGNGYKAIMVRGL